MVFTQKLPFITAPVTADAGGLRFELEFWCALGTTPQLSPLYHGPPHSFHGKYVLVCDVGVQTTHVPMYSSRHAQIHYLNSAEL